MKTIVILITFLIAIAGCNNPETKVTTTENVTDSSGYASMVDNYVADSAATLSADSSMAYFVTLDSLVTEPPQPAKSKIAGSVKWIAKYAGNRPPAKVACSAIPVPYGFGIVGPRGMAGAEDCLRVAIYFYLINERENAISWLCAAECHNSEMQGLFRTYPDFSMHQAIGRYKLHVLRNPSAIIETLDQTGIYRWVKLIIH